MEMPWHSLKKQTDAFVDVVKDQLGGIVLVVAALWAVFGLDVVASFFNFDLASWLAMRPRQLIGLPGIVTMPLAHGNFGHIVGNTFGLVFALLALAVLRPKSWMSVLTGVYLVSGVLTWLFGSLGTGVPIVGASAVIMGLMTFLLAPILFMMSWWCLNRLTKQHRPFPIDIQFVPLAVSVVAALFYFDNLFFGLVPIPSMTMAMHTSWSSHWCGAIAGLIVAFNYLRSEQRKVTITPTGKKSILEQTFS